MKRIEGPQRRSALSLERLEKKVGQLRQDKDQSDTGEDTLSIVFEALHSSVNGIIITNLQSVIVYCNPSFMRMFGYQHANDVTGIR